MIPEDTTIADYMKFFGDAPGGRAIRWQIASDYTERLDVLEEALADCYGHLMDARGLSKDRGEDELTMQIAQMLNMAGIPATHDQHVNGRCDLVVKADGGFMWLGEAKVHGSYGWLESGFLQLSTRYGTAMLGRDHGELIVYHRTGNSAKVLNTWKEALFEKYKTVELLDDKIDSQLFFRTQHPCENSGCNFFIRHTIVPLQHKPKK